MSLQELQSDGVYIVGEGGLLLPYQSQPDTYIRSAKDLEQVVYSRDGSLLATMPTSRRDISQPNGGNIICNYFDPAKDGSLIKIFEKITPQIGWKLGKPPRTPEEAYSRAIAFSALESAGITPNLFDETRKWVPKKETMDDLNTEPLNVAVGFTNSLGAVGVIAKTAREGITPDTVMDTSRGGFLGDFTIPILYSLRSLGPPLLSVGACGTSILQLDQAFDKLVNGKADLAIVGALDLASDDIYPYVLGNTAAYANFEKYADRPGDSVRPGDIDVKGMAVSEGGCCFILATGATIDRLDIPREKISARILATSTAQDPARLDPPVPPSAMPFVEKQAIKLAKLEPSNINVAILHGTGTLNGDKHDWNSQRIVFSLPEREFGNEPDVDISGSPTFTLPKSKTGHTFAGSGMISMRTMIDIFKRQEVPGTRNIYRKHGTVFNLVDGENRSQPVRYGLVVNYGVAGEAGAIIMENING